MRASAILTYQQQRQWPPPRRPWVMAQQWHDLLFAHWPMRPDALRSLIPAALDLDTFEGEAWVGIVPFRMSGVRPRGLPPVPWLSAFPEMNLRTYVTLDGKPGVWFFSLDAGNPIAVALARTFFHLPYFNAQMRLRRDREYISYGSIRTHRHASNATVHARYRPTGSVYHASPGSLDFWLTERYCLYAATDDARIYRGDIHHMQWPLQPAEAEFHRQSLTAAHRITLPGTSPLLHFSAWQQVLIWPPTRVR